LNDIFVADNWRIFNPKATEFGEITAITPFRIIQGHRFSYHSKGYMQISYAFQQCKNLKIGYDLAKLPSV